MSSSASSSSDPTSHLNDSHKQQLLNYMKFFRSRIDNTNKEITGAFDDAKDMRVLEEMYSADEVKSLLDGVRTIVAAACRDEMDKWASQSSLFLRHLMLQAEGNAVQLHLDTHTLEDVELLAGLKKLELESTKSKQLAVDAAEASSRKLTAISGATDIKLVTRVKDLEEANRSLLAKFDKLQIQCRAAMQENTDVKEKNAQLEGLVAQTRSDMSNLKSANRDAQQSEIDSLRAQLDKMKQEHATKLTEVQKEVKAAQDAAAEKVNQSPQFQQLKKMLLQKNQQLKEARDKAKQGGE